MGAWGTNIFSNDSACDIRDHYREQIENGVDDAEALSATLGKFKNYFDDPEEGTVCIVALAVTQSKIGRLDPAVCKRALAAIDSGADQEIWKSDNPKLLPKRKEALKKAREQISGPQPARKKLKPSSRPSCGLSAGDVLVLDIPGKLAILRIVKVVSHRAGETPYLEELEYEGSEVPSAEVLETLQAKTENPIAMVDAYSRDTRLSAFVGHDKVGWNEAGFKKVANISARPDDDKASTPGFGSSWSGLLERYRRHLVK